MSLKKAAWTALRVAPVFVLLACGSDEPGAVNLGNIDAGPREDAGGSVRDAGKGNEKGPLVEITSPAAVADPLTGPVLTGPSVDVQCQARQRPGAAPVDPTKVSIAVYGANTGASSDPILKVPATLRATDTYGASVALTSVPTGRVRLRCTAIDSASSAPAENLAEIDTYYDGGPVITFTNLNENSVISRGTNNNIDLGLQFKVEPARLTDSDPGAEIADVKLSISERDVTLGPPVDTTYKKEVDFLDFFAGAPIESVTLEVTATNTRNPTRATVKKKLIVKVDGQGPKIAFTAPTGSPPLVGGTVSVEATITDDLAGVAEGDDKVYALIQDLQGPRNYRLTRDGDKYRFTFEASAFPGRGDVTATVYAHDKAGNEALESMLMRLDTVPPWLSLDAPDVREITGMPRKCSGPFDPLGDSPEPGEVVGVEALFRAIVWERGLVFEGAKIWIAGVRDDTVELYAQSYGNDAALSAPPLLIDEDRDEHHYCDAVNTTPTSGLAPAPQALVPIGAGGQQALGPDTFGQDPAVTAEDACEPATSQSQPRCGTDTALRYVINHTMETTPPVVYATAPTQGSGVGCTGTEFDLGLPGGWTAVVAVARDRSGVQGNLGISEPLWVCRKATTTDCGGVALGTVLELPPGLNATDGCVLPPIWSEPAMPRKLNH